MSTTGVCQICENAPAEHRCEQCGTLVCAAHFNRTQGLCVRCAGAGEPGPGVGPETMS